MAPGCGRGCGVRAGGPGSGRTGTPGQAWEMRLGGGVRLAGSRQDQEGSLLIRRLEEQRSESHQRLQGLVTVG